MAENTQNAEEAAISSRKIGCRASSQKALLVMPKKVRMSRVSQTKSNCVQFCFIPLLGDERTEKAGRLHKTQAVVQANAAKSHWSFRPFSVIPYKERVFDT